MEMNDYDREATEGMLFVIVSAFEAELGELTILEAERIGHGGWFFNCRLFYEDGMKMDVPFVYYEGNDWVFTPCDWQGKLPGKADEIDTIGWRVDDTETEGIIFDGQPVLAPWVADMEEDLAYQRRREIGVKIAEARRVQGLTVRELADRCGMSKNHISRIETGKYNYTIDTLLEVTGELGLNVTMG